MFDFIKRKDTDIFEVCEKDDWRALKRLISHNIDINRKNDDNMTPLMIACRNDSVKCLKVLLEHPDIDVNILNTIEDTALIISCTNNHHRCVSALLKHPGINVKHVNKSGCCALSAAFLSRSDRVLSILCKDARILNNSMYRSLSVRNLYQICPSKKNYEYCEY